MTVEEEARSGSTFNTPRLLILINPAAGKGNGVSLFRKHVQPMFEMAEIKCTVLVTGKEVTVYLYINSRGSDLILDIFSDVWLCILKAFGNHSWDAIIGHFVCHDHSGAHCG